MTDSCSICLDDLKNPRRTQCNHIFCYKMDLGEKLPYDLKEYIEKILACSMIQNKFRNHRFRHCNRKEWSELRKLLLKNINYNDLDILYKHNWILCEWRTEPQSWIFMLVNEDENLKEIIKECKEYSV